MTKDRRPGLAFCDDCLRKALNISRYHLSEKGISETAAAAGLVREWDTCTLCGKRRVVTKATNPKSGKKVGTQLAGELHRIIHEGMPLNTLRVIGLELPALREPPIRTPSRSPRSPVQALRNRTDAISALTYKSRPSGRLGPEAVNFFRNVRLRSLFASRCFRLRWNRALSPLSADMTTPEYQGPSKADYSASLTMRPWLLNPGLC